MNNIVPGSLVCNTPEVFLWPTPSVGTAEGDSDPIPENDDDWFKIGTLMLVIGVVKCGGLLSCLVLCPRSRIGWVNVLWVRKC